MNSEAASSAELLARHLVNQTAEMWVVEMAYQLEKQLVATMVEWMV